MNDSAFNCPLPPPNGAPPQGLTPYADAVAFMQDRVAAIRAGTALNWSGWWSTRRSTPPAPPPGPSN